MRDQRLGVEFAIGNELQRLFAVAIVNAAGLEGQIFAVHIGEGKRLRLVVKRHHCDNGITFVLHGRLFGLVNQDEFPLDMYV